MNLSDFKIENTGNIETFKKQLTEVLEKYENYRPSWS